MTNLRMAQALLFEPRAVFTELDARPRFWWPLLVLAGAMAATVVWYVSFVDLEWLSFQELSQSSFGQNMTDAEILRQARQSAERPGVQMVFRAFFGAVGVAVGLLISGLYYLLAGKVTGVRRSYRHWLSLSAWVSLPGVLGVIPAALVMLTSDTTQLPQTSLQALSLNSLFFGLEQGQTGFALATGINLFQFLGLYLSVIAVKLWSGRGWLFSFVFSALPLMLVVGIWALVALR